MQLENALRKQFWRADLGESSVTHRKFARRYITSGSFHIGIYVLYHVTRRRIKSIAGGDMKRLTRLDKTHDQYFISVCGVIPCNLWRIESKMIHKNLICVKYLIIDSILSMNIILL